MSGQKKKKKKQEIKTIVTVILNTETFSPQLIPRPWFSSEQSVVIISRHLSAFIYLDQRLDTGLEDHVGVEQEGP